MYGNFHYIWLIVMVHVGKYTIYGSYRFHNGSIVSNPLNIYDNSANQTENTELAEVLPKMQLCSKWR